MLSREQLADGAVPEALVWAAADAASIPERSLISAASALGVRIQRGQWWLPGLKLKFRARTARSLRSGTAPLLFPRRIGHRKPAPRRVWRWCEDGFSTASPERGADRISNAQHKPNFIGL
jgi:hypothetical protein